MPVFDITIENERTSFINHVRMALDAGKVSLTKGKQHLIQIEKIQQTASINAKSYFHVCVGIFADYFGMSDESAKNTLKEKFGFARKVYNPRLMDYIMEYDSVADMGEKTLWDFTNSIRDFAALEGCYIPTSEEYKRNKSRIDRQLSETALYRKL